MRMERALALLLLGSLEFTTLFVQPVVAVQASRSASGRDLEYETSR